MSTLNQNARALAIMDRVAARTGLTPEGRNALLQLVNPFADFDIPRTGYFDTNESSSVVQCVKFSQTYAAPTGIVAGTNWDCHVATLPLINGPPSGAVLCPASNTTGYTFYSGSVSLNTIGGVTVMAGPAGFTLTVQNLVNNSLASTYCDGTSLSPQLTQYTSPPGAQYLDGQCRVIGMGFEVHNTTSALNVQGAVAVYRQPQPIWLDRSDTKICNVSAGTVAAPTTAAFQGSGSLQAFYDVPAGLSSVMLLNGTRQWEAKDGCMVIPTLNDMNIPVQSASTVVPFVRGPAAAITLTGISTFPSMKAGYLGATAVGFGNNQSLAVGTATLSSAQLPYSHYGNFNTSGAYFTGLSYSTTLTINSIYYIERFPVPSDTNLVVLANPSPPYSSVAMDLYPEMLRFLPPGCKVGDNADGDWFFEAIKTVSDFLSPALGAAGAFVNPALGPAAIGFGKAASSWADMKLKERNPGQPQAQKKKKKKNNNNPQKKSAAAPKGRQPGRPLTISKVVWDSLTPAERRKIGI
jgi:hypothetical protein